MLVSQAGVGKIGEPEMVTGAVVNGGAGCSRSTGTDGDASVGGIIRGWKASL